MAFLKGRGYRTIQVASGWAGTRVNPYADEVRAGRNHVMDDDFTRALVDSSLLELYNGRLLRDMAMFYLEQFDRLEEYGGRPRPEDGLFPLPPPPSPVYLRPGRRRRAERLFRGHPLVPQSPMAPHRRLHRAAAVPQHEASRRPSAPSSGRPPRLRSSFSSPTMAPSSSRRTRRPRSGPGSTT